MSKGLCYICCSLVYLYYPKCSNPEKCVILFKLTLCFIWSAVTSRKESKKLANTAKCNVNKT